MVIKLDPDKSFSLNMFISPTCFTELYKTINTTEKHQQHNQEMLSGSITSMRFYFIVPYVAKKKNIYVSSSQAHRTVIFMWNLKDCLLWYSCELTLQHPLFSCFWLTFCLSFMYKSRLMKSTEFQYCHLFLCLPT